MLVQQEWRAGHPHFERNGSWVTIKIQLHGPFYTAKTAEEFADKVADGAPRVRWTLGEGSVRRKGQTRIVTDGDGARRTIVTVERVRPSHVRRAWASIRTWLRDQPIRPSAERRSA